MNGVNAEFTATLVSCESVPVWVSLMWYPHDPYAVHAQFHLSDAGSVLWSLDRELLSFGLSVPFGAGDVHVFPDIAGHADDEPGNGEPVVMLLLSSPTGDAVIEVPAEPLARFLAETYAEVASGTEALCIDIDAELALLLGECTERED